MDRLTLTSLVLFTIADVFAVVSLIKPDWIVTSVGGTVVFYSSHSIFGIIVWLNAPLWGEIAINLT